ncbi:MAG: hypothetical protein NC913_09155, partial [Candidatus Omnitrophica bacterium]|nr:hypothetical protein [Candidatus Omnitrophota bacterium]
MNISIKPVDVLFFRDSKPFGRGSEHFTRSIFPPFSQTLYGAFRTKVLEDVGCNYEEFKKGNLILGKKKNKIDIEKIKKEIGTPAEPGQFLLKGPLILKDDEVIYLKIPADVKCSKENGKKYMILKPFDWKTVGIETDFDGDQCFPHVKTEVPLENVEGYISLSDFVSSYLIGEKNFEEKCVEEPENIFQYEMRIGLKIDSKSYTAEERMLYTVGVVRLNSNFSLFVRIENLTTLKPVGLIKLGGLNKVCEYKELSNNPLNVLSKAQEQIKEKIYNTKKFKII